MTTARANAPVIIKRKKIIGGGGHHGGAWKVAYADFVTAMMAFFMLMWLLNATTENQRKGIADYFNPTIPLNRISGGGSGSFGGDTVFSEETMAKSGPGGSKIHHVDEDRSRGQSGVESSGTGEGEGDDRKLMELAEKLTARSGESMVSDELARHIMTRVTDEGLIVELFDLPENRLFAPGSVEPTPLMRELVGVVAQVFELAENRIALGGHVRSEPVVRIDSGVWDLSAHRAQAVRGLLRHTALNEKRLQRVTGFADRELVVANPMSPRNNRIELTLLRQGRRS